MPNKRDKGCPLCDQPASADHAPFCSRRCQDRDLLQWLGEGYSIPGPAVDEAQLPGGVDSEESGS